MKTLTNIPVLLLPAEPEGKSEVRCLLSAPLPIDITKGSRTFEYWLCDIILIPKKKYTENGEDFKGWKFSDILHCPDWPNPDRWIEVVE